jgi:hypothetical protein
MATAKQSVGPDAPLTRPDVRSSFRLRCTGRRSATDVLRTRVGCCVRPARGRLVGSPAGACPYSGAGSPDQLFRNQKLSSVMPYSFRSLLASVAGSQATS